MKRPVIRRDPRREALAHAEVACFPRDFVAERHETGRHAGDGAFSGEGCRLDVYFDTPREVEAAADRCGDIERDVDPRHGSDLRERHEFLHELGMVLPGPEFDELVGWVSHEVRVEPRERGDLEEAHEVRAFVVEKDTPWRLIDESVKSDAAGAIARSLGRRATKP